VPPPPPGGPFQDYVYDSLAQFGFSDWVFFFFFFFFQDVPGPSERFLLLLGP